MENTIILNSGQKIEVLFQDEVSLNIDCSLRYIKSGQKEIQDYVDNVSKQKLEDVIDAAVVTMNNQVLQCVADATSAAKEATTDTINNEIKSVQSKLDTHVATEIMPIINSKSAETVSNAAKAEEASVQAGKSAEDALSYAQSINTGNIVHTFGNETIEGIKEFLSSPSVPTADFNSNDSTVASTAFVTDKLSFAISAGALMAFAGSTPPNGWLKCDGSLISRTTYANLFAVIGTTYGSGDGVTTFALPNFINRTFWGGTGTGKNLSQTLPNIKGTIAADTSNAGGSGAFSIISGTSVKGIAGASGAHATYLSFNANQSSSVYQDGASVRPNVVQTLICIKY